MTLDDRIAAILRDAGWPDDGVSLLNDEKVRVTSVRYENGMTIIDVWPDEDVWSSDEADE